ncbi:MAG: SRPBCC domain-containing protein [Candidatus Thiodiazotropha weberae]|nr:SRPBCC domain-containing protein [Candidatus Thiodiazotropha endoloripes]MCG7899965.1 SRPBCC domain-containing protein [Candidatus Thiodiazotropha weberae]MCG7915162.1 SRPBCC domain-containing protein [Candidatus Thiodiazotropha weberae]MCG7991221.1 SRPBCC domain-containing protein [Candidatus Thiodiazotropha lotti]MCW4182876.1 SRPBCC domain-containing protein [Candidatus Thiodiazotropha weberae]
MRINALIPGYARQIVVTATPAITFQALTAEIDQWWTTNCNVITQVGDRVTFRFDSTYWVMEVVRLSENRLIELLCIEAHHLHEGLPASIEKEWEGTKLKWALKAVDGATQVDFIHEGLVSELDCYEICEQGWNFYFASSLKEYLETGRGSPYQSAET